MAGLLGMDEDMQMALLASLLGAASASGVRPGTALARGGLLGMNVYQDRKAGRQEGQRQARDDEFRQWQMDEAKRKAAADQERQAAMAQAFQGAMIPGQQAQPPVEFGGGEGTRPGMPAVPPSFDPQKFAMGMSSVDPMGAAQMLTPKAQESPYAKINPKDYTLESLREFTRTKDPAVLVPRDTTKPPSKWVDMPAPPGGQGQQWQRNIDTDEIRAVGSRAPVTNITTNNYPDLPKGYMWTDPGNPRAGVTPLPNSPEAQATARLREGNLATANIVLEKVGQARDIVDKSPIPTTGMVGGAVLSRVPGTPGYNLARVVDTIKANVGFDALNQMRAQSPTGGALGQVSERENQYLQAKIASLEQSQSKEQFLRALNDVEKAFNVVVHGPAGGAGVIRGGGNKGGRVKFSDLPE